MLVARPGIASGTVEDRKGHDRRYSLDISKISAELGYSTRQSPSITVFAETVAWYRDNRSWWEPLKAKAALPNAPREHDRMNRWLVTGSGGMLGQGPAGQRSVEQPDLKLTPLTRADIDLATADQDAVHDIVAGHDLVINAAAWTDVDGAETAEAAATAVNGHAGRRAGPGMRGR